MRVDFWQLSKDPAEKVVAMIAARVLGEGERLLVVSDDAEQRKRVSKALWDAKPEAFLANGDASEPHADRQPILLSNACLASNDASHVIFADGEWREAQGFARAFLLFDDATVEAARGVWRSLDGADGLERSFFRQEGGKWVKVA